MRPSSVTLIGSGVIQSKPKFGVGIHLNIEFGFSPFFFIFLIRFLFFSSCWKFINLIPSKSLLYIAILTRLFLLNHL